MLEKWAPAIAAAALVFTPARQAMPSEPDFSGRWQLVSAVPPGADPPLPMTVMQTIARTDVFGNPMTPFFKELLVIRESAKGPLTERHLIGVVGGSVSGVVAGRPRTGTTQRFSVTWEGRTLVFETSRYTGPEDRTGEWDERREEWSFDTDGRLRVVITSRTSTSPAASSVTHIYQRR